MASAEGETGSAPPEVSDLKEVSSSEEPVREILRDSLRSLPKLVGQINVKFVHHLRKKAKLKPIIKTDYNKNWQEKRKETLNLGEDVVKINIDWRKLQHASAFQPVLLFTTLQQHISALQPFIDKLQSLIKEESTALVTDSKTEDKKCETNLNVTDKEVHMEEKRTPCGSGSMKMSRVDFDPEVVQIKAGKAEIERRISAFIERKQAEINENNVREFCNVIDCNQENSCARTDAVFTPYPGFKSHVKVSRVLNTYGPQTRSEGIYGSSHKSNNIPRDCGNQAVEERLQNIEAHLRLQTGGPVPKDIYQRIKKLEDKILELEGMSPEYFQSVNFSSKRRKVQQRQNYSLAELDEKINALKQTILRKTNEGRPRAVDQLL